MCMCVHCCVFAHIPVCMCVFIIYGLYVEVKRQPLVQPSPLTLCESLWVCHANWPTSFQGLSCLLLPSYHRKARITNVHQGFLLFWGSLDRHWYPHTYKVTTVLLSHFLNLMPAFPWLCWTGSEQKCDLSSWHRETAQFYYTLNHSLNFNQYGTQLNTSIFCTKGLRNQVFYKILFWRI